MQNSDVIKLKKIYELGIERTNWKSCVLDKLNALRILLGLKEVYSPLARGEYDEQAVDVLSGIDFGELDQNWATKFLGWTECNACLVLSCAGIGFTAVV